MRPYPRVSPDLQGPYRSRCRASQHRLLLPKIVHFCTWDEIICTSRLEHYDGCQVLTVLRMASRVPVDLSKISGWQLSWYANLNRNDQWCLTSIVQCWILRQLRIQANLCRLGHHMRAHGRVANNGTCRSFRFLSAISPLPTVCLRTVSDRHLHDFAMYISFIKVSSSWEHAGLEVDDLMATIWAGYKELDEPYVSMPLPGVCPSCVYPFRFFADTNCPITLPPMHCLAVPPQRTAVDECLSRALPTPPSILFQNPQMGPPLLICFWSCTSSVPSEMCSLPSVHVQAWSLLSGTQGCPCDRPR